MAEQLMRDQSGNLYEWRGGQWQPYQAAQDVGPLQAGIISAGATFAEAGQAVRNLLGQDVSEQAAEREQLMAPLRERYPVATTAGAVAPHLATAPLGFGAGGLGSLALREAAIGAALGATTQYRERPVEQLLHGALMGAAGGAGGAVAGNLAGRVMARIGNIARRSSRADLRAELPDFSVEGAATRTRGSVADQAADLAQVSDEAGEYLGTGARGLGRELSPEARADIRNAQALGWRFEDADFSPAMARLRASAESHPLLATAASWNREANRQTLVNTYARALGIGDGELSPTRIGQAADAIRDKFAAVEANIGAASPAPLRRVARDIVEKGREGLVGSEAVDIARRVVEATEDGAPVPGRVLTTWRSQLNDAYRRATSPTGRPDQFGADNLEKMQNALDRIVEDASPTGYKGLYKQAREQYRLLTALRRGRALREDGELNIPTLAGNLRRVYRREYGEGADADLAPEIRNALRLTRTAQRFDPRIGDSGTATRLALQNMAGDVQGMAMSLAARPLGAVAGSIMRRAPSELPGGVVDELVQRAGTTGGAIGRGLALGAE